ncbi:MAG TPA: long-chain fatty acid--CoA ligase [Planctomycetota bacterium]|nr:long-chain fatty acid--CoA ligase [Planctomycetota bacterium]
MEADPLTLAELFIRGIEAFPRPDRFLRKQDGAYRPVSSQEFGRQVRACAGALAGLGLTKGDRVAILSYNRIEWAVADFACQLLGIVDVPIYSTLPPDQCAFILKDSGAKAAFVEDADQASKIRGVVPHLIAFDPADGTRSFEEFLRTGTEATPAAIDPEDLATIIYTSGTTGVPKGVMLTHRNLVSNILASGKAFDVTPRDTILSFLPLSHSFERIFDYLFFWWGASIAYAEDTDKVAENMLEVRPSIMAAVPRFYEKVHARIRKSVADQKPWKRGLFEWARGVGAEAGEFWRRGKAPTLRLRLRYGLAKLLVLHRLQGRVGGRIRFFVSGGGALSREVAEYFHSIGLPILEGYGLTETSPVLTVNRLGATRLGTVGPALAGVELRIAADGEILARGPNIMKGYYNKPEETAQVVQDGWFSTGDIGEIDAEGFLKITDRKKDLLKTSGGKYIAPGPIEGKLKLFPRIQNAIVIGDRRKFPAALIVPSKGATKEEIANDVATLNEALAHHEQIKRFELIPTEFSIEGGELTPTLKVRRRIVEQKYKSVIDAIYAE